MSETDADTDVTATAGAEAGSGAGTHTFGLERWVQFGFIIAAVIGVWLLDHVIRLVWDIFAEPDTTIVTGAAIVIAAVGAFIAYRSESVNEWASEVALELSKVTWPQRRETWTNTVVVMVTSAIAAVILFGFDSAWSALTDLIY